MKYYYYNISGCEPERGPETAHQSCSCFLLPRRTCHSGGSRSIFLCHYLVLSRDQNMIYHKKISSAFKDAPIKNFSECWMN